MQRKEQVAEWIRLVEAEATKGGQVDPPLGGTQPKNKGIRAAARELPISGKTEDARRKSAERAVKVAAIAPEAKAAVQAAGLDNNQRALLRVAAAPQAEQVAAVAAIVTEKAERASERSPEITFNVWIEQGRRWLATGSDEFQARAREALPFPLSLRDAILHSAGANATHGLRRSNADKRRAVLILLEDEEWSGWSDNAIAKACAVSQPFVTKIKEVHLQTFEDAPRTVSRGGNVYTMDTAGIGRRPTAASLEIPAADPAPAEPQAEAELPAEPTNIVPLAPRLPDLPPPPERGARGWGQTPQSYLSATPLYPITY